MRPGESIAIRVLVMLRQPLGFDFIMGMNGVNVLGDVMVSANGHVRFSA